MWQSQVENEHYSTVSGLVISLECFIEITPDFLCPFMNDCMGPYYGKASMAYTTHYNSIGHEQ